MNKIFTAFLLLFILILTACAKITPQDTSVNSENVQLSNGYSDIKMYRFSREWKDQGNFNYKDGYKYYIDRYTYLGDNKAIATIGVSPNDCQKDENSSELIIVADFKENKYLNDVKSYQNYMFNMSFYPQIYDENHFIMESISNENTGLKTNYIFYNKDGKAEGVKTYKLNEYYDDEIIVNIFKRFKKYSYIDGKIYTVNKGDVRVEQEDSGIDKYKVIFDGDDHLNLPVVKYSLIMFDNENTFVTKKTVTELYNPNEIIGLNGDQSKLHEQEYFLYKEYTNEYCLYNPKDNNQKFSKKYPYDPIYAMGNKIIFTNSDKTELYYAETDVETVIKEPKMFYKSGSFSYFNFSPDNKYIAAAELTMEKKDDSKQVITGIKLSVFDTTGFKCITEKTINVNADEKLLFDINGYYNLNVLPNGSISFELDNDDFVYNFLLEKT